MPTNLIDTRNYGTSRPTCLAGDNYADRMVTVDLDYIQPDTDGHQIIKQGYPLLLLASGYGRLYPYTELETAITTSATDLEVGEGAAYFAEADSVVVARPYAYLTLASTWANADTATIVFDGRTIVHTVASYSTLTALATAIAATLNADAVFAASATAIAENQYVHIFGKTNEAYSLSISGDGTAGSGTITASAATLQKNVTVGTIDTAGIDTDTNTLTIASAAAIRLPVGAPLAIAASPSSIIGLAGYDTFVGSTQTEITPESNDISAWNRGRFYRDRLPVWDEWLQAALPMVVPVPS